LPRERLREIQTLWRRAVIRAGELRAERRAGGPVPSVVERPSTGGCTLMADESALPRRRPLAAIRAGCPRRAADRPALTEVRPGGSGPESEWPGGASLNTYAWTPMTMTMTWTGPSASAPPLVGARHMVSEWLKVAIAENI
jgi:hypothetical protein